jgi:hypothetical protein
MPLRLFGALAGVFAAILLQCWLHGGLAGVGLGLIGGAFALVLVLLIVGVHLAQPAATGRGEAHPASARLRPRRRLALIVVLAMPMAYAYLLLLVRGLCPDCAAWWAGVFAPRLEDVMPSAEVMRVAWALAGNEGIGLVNAHALGFAMLWGAALVILATLFLTRAAYRWARAGDTPDMAVSKVRPEPRWWHGIALLALFGYMVLGMWSGAGHVDESGAFHTRRGGPVLSFNALGLVFLAQVYWLALAIVPLSIAVSLGRWASAR